MEKLKDVQSLCPVCKKVAQGSYVTVKGNVYFQINCKDHGQFQTLAGNNALDFTHWCENKVTNIPPKVALTKARQGDGGSGHCPLDCGTCENHLQTACCVVIDLTNKCNQYCPYCFANAQLTQKDIKEPCLEEIKQKLNFLLEVGEAREFNLQLSGGEPTMREDFAQIIKLCKEKGFDYVQINTNGKRIGLEEGYAQTLKDAGASVIYLQFDGMENEIYQELRNEDLLEVKKKAIAHCREAKLPVILVPTVVRNVNLKKIGAIIEFMLEHLDVVKGIHFQPAAFFGRHPFSPNLAEDYPERVTMFDVMDEIHRQTNGKISLADLLPISTGHPLCCFYGTFIKEGDQIKSLISEERRNNGISCCEERTPLEVVRKDRDFVLNKWSVGEEPIKECCGCSCEHQGEDIVWSFDDFINHFKKNTFTLSAMAFMDEHNLDAERLKRCRVHQLTQDNRLIPFCAYNSIYRKEEQS